MTTIDDAEAPPNLLRLGSHSLIGVGLTVAQVQALVAGREVRLGTRFVVRMDERVKLPMRAVFEGDWR